ncbi:glycosyltransferase [Phenylobacterium sp. LjRoot219]|uniref:glycosyltransferase n=1 Tax=Phenylobacterium sp. LjRoot219 TaxID=3342283 RepID=UPI003ECDE237
MRLKVLYVLPPTKSYAGVERVVDEICSEIADKYQSIDLDVLFTSSYDAAQASPRYNRIQERVSGRLDLLRTVRRVAAHKPYDLVVAPQVEATVLFWLACLGLGRRFVLYLHGNPRRERSHYKAKILFALMRRLVVHRLGGVFGTSPKQLASFRRMFPSAAPHYWVPNPVRRFDPDGPDAPPSPGLIRFAKVGRFSYQKGHDQLLRAFSRLYEQRKDVRLVLVGYGVEEPRLRAQIDALGLDEVVEIAHHPFDPAPTLRETDVYVSASRWEGWSLAICEALRFGLPVVATDCEFGPSDILADRRLGRLTPPGDEAALAEAMLYYCDNLEAERASAPFRQAYVARFDVERVVHVHAEALTAIVGAVRAPRSAASPASASRPQEA